MIQLLCYDIENDSLRQKLARLLEKQGWERIQKSVFTLQTNNEKWKIISLKIQDFLHKNLQPSDKVFIWQMSKQQFSNVLVLGGQLDIRWLINDYCAFYWGESNMLK